MGKHWVFVHHYWHLCINIGICASILAFVHRYWHLCIDISIRASILAFVYQYWHLCIKFCMCASSFVCVHHVLYVCIKFCICASMFVFVHYVLYLCIKFCICASSFVFVHQVLYLCIKFHLFLFPEVTNANDEEEDAITHLNLTTDTTKWRAGLFNILTHCKLEANIRKTLVVLQIQVSHIINHTRMKAWHSSDRKSRKSWSNYAWSGTSVVINSGHSVFPKS